MNFNLTGNPEYGQLDVQLAPGEMFLAESGAMAWMTDGMQVKSRLMGGLPQAAVRKLLGGESLFVGEYSHPTGGAAAFSPSTPGSVLRRTLNNDRFLLTAGSFLACSPGVSIKARFGGFKAFFSGEGAFYLDCTGQGELFFTSYGAVTEREVNGSFIVDTSHVVGWEPTLDYTVRAVGGLKSTLFSGEGLVLEFRGVGKVFLQTRTLKGLAGWLTPMLH
jgi:uncharacterized protein (TIGR00266 family)